MFFLSPNCRLQCTIAAGYYVSPNGVKKVLWNKYIADGCVDRYAKVLLICSALNYF